MKPQAPERLGVDAEVCEWARISDRDLRSLLADSRLARIAVPCVQLGARLLRPGLKSFSRFVHTTDTVAEDVGPKRDRKGCSMDTTMPEAREKTRALLANATPGPWDFDERNLGGGRKDCVVFCGNSSVVARTSDGIGLLEALGAQVGGCAENAALIAAAPGLLAALCDENDALRAEADATRVERDVVDRECDRLRAQADADRQELTRMAEKVARLEMRKAALCTRCHGDPRVLYCGGCNGAGAVIVDGGE